MVVSETGHIEPEECQALGAYTARWMATFLDDALASGEVKGALRRAGVSLLEYRKARNLDPAFDAACLELDELVRLGTIQSLEILAADGDIRAVKILAQGVGKLAQPRPLGGLTPLGGPGTTVAGHIPGSDPEYRRFADRPDGGWLYASVPEVHGGWLRSFVGRGWTVHTDHGGMAQVIAPAAIPRAEVETLMHVLGAITLLATSLHEEGREVTVESLTAAWNRDLRCGSCNAPIDHQAQAEAVAGDEPPGAPAAVLCPRCARARTAGIDPPTPCPDCRPPR